MDLVTSLSFNPQVPVNASSSRPKSDKKHLCFYHRRFGAKAHKRLTRTFATLSWLQKTQLPPAYNNPIAGGQHK
ncbi:Hypothetical protein FKW44_001038 [Caligus rogercresseyi]|uniref:Uncharacterized protein n=1 Tax=Caligus rogercresseyi TaxID=217165 RepID=A0A7T8QVB1_CALRO|nr:Hypothetical protein FKW44_001038 [Caligus rogercresseyi]